jgi:hypothetical protein
MRNSYKILIGKPERKIQFGRPRRRRGDMRMDLRETGWELVDWIRLAEDRLQWWAVVNRVMTLLIP